MDWPQFFFSSSSSTRKNPELYREERFVIQTRKYAELVLQPYLPRRGEPSPHLEEVTMHFAPCGFPSIVPKLVP